MGLRQWYQNLASRDVSEEPGVKRGNILDPVHQTLDPSVFDDPASPAPVFKETHRLWIVSQIGDVLDKAGYDGMERWLGLVLTGSLTTYQFSEESDCDISLWVDVHFFPEWSRAEMIGLMVEHMDGKLLPGTTHPMQDFVVDTKKFSREDLYKPGLRSALDLLTNEWIVPPDKTHAHDVEREMNEAYTIALQNADKMERLLKYEPQKAIKFWHQIHSRRQRDMQAGKGDYAPSNITYKLLANRGLFPAISEVSGEYIAHVAPAIEYSPRPVRVAKPEIEAPPEPEPVEEPPAEEVETEQLYIEPAEIAIPKSEPEPRDPLVEDSPIRPPEPELSEEWPSEPELVEEWPDPEPEPAPEIPEAFASTIDALGETVSDLAKVVSALSSKDQAIVVSRDEVGRIASVAEDPQRVPYRARKLVVKRDSMGRIASIEEEE